MLLMDDEKLYLHKFYNQKTGKLNPKWSKVCDNSLLLKIKNFHGITWNERLYNALKDQINGEYCICGKLKKFNKTGYRKSCTISCSRSRIFCDLYAKVLTIEECKHELSIKSRNAINWNSDSLNRSIYFHTNFLPINTHCQQRVYHILNDLRHIPTCYCGQDISFRNSDYGYNKFCSLKCAAIKSSKYRKNEYKNGKVFREGAYKLNHENLLSLYNDHIVHKKTIKELAQNYNMSSWGVCQRLKELELDVNIYGGSTYEDTLCNFLDLYNIQYIKNDRKLIKPLELDIFIPSHNVGIEINGTWSHSTRHDRYKNNKKYHLEKMNICKSNNIKLLQFWTSEIDKKLPIIQSIILNKLGISRKIYARKCEIVSVENKIAKQFYNNNHLQGGCAKASVHLGLHHNNELVALMSFSKCRFHKKYNWELVRYACGLNLQIVGGASKILSYFTKINSGNIVSYADLRYSNGDLYHKLGFTLSHQTPVNYSYVIGRSLHSRYKFQKKYLSTRLQFYDETLTEEINMENNNIYRVYDCGNLVFVYENQ
jgi:hypothetical protein